MAVRNGRLTARQLVGDAVLAAALGIVSVGLLGTMDAPTSAYALAGVHTAAVAGRRWAPLPAAVCGLAAAGVFAAAGYPIVGLGPAALVWLYSIGAEVERRAALALLAAALATVSYMVLVNDQGDGGTLVGDVVALGVAFMLGDAARRRRQMVDLLRERAEQLELAQTEVARRAAAEERLRIAREMHDVVAHSMSVIAVQASTGRLVIDEAPEQARASLVAIEDASRSALAEMRAVLGVLRAGGDGDDRAPQPTLDGIPELAARTVGTGGAVAVRIEGRRRSLPPGLELAAYRIVQEALTNVARHAAGADSCVVLTYGDETLAIEVVNGPVREPYGRPAAATRGAGQGLIGMRERAALYGGDVEAGALPDGGFRVSTVLRDGSGR